VYQVRTKAAADITMEMMMDGSWKTQKFKPYNFDALGQDPAAGRLHPLLKVRQQFREIFLEMGFEEMPTQRFVETSFWNFDSLFQPQAHPARDMQDTFFIKDPATTLRIPKAYKDKVKNTHERGDCQTGGPQDPAGTPIASLGYRNDWALAEAEKNLLRTHTTAISAQMLYKLAQMDKFEPKKFFSIDRVFRNGVCVCVCVCVYARAGTHTHTHTCMYVQRASTPPTWLSSTRLKVLWWIAD
jgi:phenylalanyl-tRNA synthetase alpha chain